VRSSSAADAGTMAWPPSFPPGHLARDPRTSDAKEQASHHGVDGVLELQDLPFTSTVICGKSRAPRPCHVAILRTWAVRLLAMESHCP